MKEFKKIKKKQLALSTLVALACAGHIGYAANPATTENGVTNNYWDITINDIKEDSGLELGNNSRARGNGSIATGTGSLAVGNNAVATGGNETKDTITRKLNENKQRLTEISNVQNTVTNLAKEIQKIRAEQAKTIEAGERVKQVRLAKEKAHQDYLNKQNAWTTEVANSAEFLRDAQSKLDDLNNRLGAVNRLGGVDINSEDGLTTAATNLKRMTEEGSTLNLPLESFYKEYIKAHYKAIGDLRLKEIEKNKYGDVTTNNNKLIYNYEFDLVSDSNFFNSPYNSILNNTVQDLMNKNMERFDNVNVNMDYIGNKNTGIKDDKIVIGGGSSLRQIMTSSNIDTINYLPELNPDTDIINQNVYDKINTFWNDYWNKIEPIFNAYKNPLIGDEDKIILKNHAYRNLAIYKSMLDSVYYQFKYEETNNTSWLDKKEQVKKSELYKKYYYEEYNNPLKRMLEEKLKEADAARTQWLNTNINDVKEKNKITTDKLNSDLEATLNINKNAVAEKEKQIAALKVAADQAKTNWESINPNASDLLYSTQYEELMRKLADKAQELQQNQERLVALRKALTLHDFNVGENAMAIGTNALSTGSNSIAIGTGTIVTGENSISIGKNSAVTGTNSIAIGVSHIVIGNNSGTLGDPNTIYGDNSYAFGNNNIIGDANTPHTIGKNTFVLGSNVTTKANNSVVLGKDSVANEDNIVSIGSTISTRKLVNVTDGTIAENSKEAITGNQLWNLSEGKEGSINKKAWQAALGTGSVTAGDKGLVTGGTVNAAITNAVNTATSNINNGIESKLNGKANTSLDNITDNGKTVIRNLSKEAIQLENGTNTTVESRVDGNTTLYKVNVSNSSITGAIAPKIAELSNAVDTKLSTKANKDASNITSDDAKKWSEKLGTGTAKAGDKGLITGDTLHTALSTVKIDPNTLTTKANTNASNLTDENVKEWTSKLGVGTVGQGESSKGLVTGKSVYEAIQQHSPKLLVKTDGKTVTVDKAGTATHIDFSGTDKNGNSILRDITGVETNTSDPTSVVNMDTLQTQSQGLEQKLTKAINVGTATASALAALHPLDYDESNKVSFAVSHGQYNGSKATAFGGFIRPNENIMLSLASTISSTDRAWNAGMSFKFSSGSSHKKINQNDFETLRKKNDKLENELNQLKEQLSKLSTRLSPKRTSFPDVPKEHWANEAIETLHGNDVLDGYPDGKFDGDKQLTRYEYAQMLYKGLK
jgi:hypothetical protein